MKTKTIVKIGRHNLNVDYVVDVRDPANDTMRTGYNLEVVTVGGTVTATYAKLSEAEKARDTILSAMVDRDVDSARLLADALAKALEESKPKAASPKPQPGPAAPKTGPADVAVDTPPSAPGNTGDAPDK